MNPLLAILILGSLAVGLLVLIAFFRERWRIRIINAKRGEWGDEVSNMLIKRQADLGMTPEMTKLAVGRPNKVDQKEIQESGLTKERWVYVRLQHSAIHVYFENNRVVRIEKI